MTGTYISGA